METTLEDKMTSLRSVSIAVILYISGYAVKLSVLIMGMLEPVISNFYLRGLASVFTGIALSTGLLIVSINSHKKYTPYVMAVMDAIVLLLVFDVFKAAKISEMITVSFISLFMAFVGYQLITVFVDKYEQIKSNAVKSISELKLVFSEIEQQVSERKQTLAKLSENTCKSCGREFGSINALNAHKRSCS